MGCIFDLSLYQSNLHGDCIRCCKELGCDLCKNAKGGNRMSCSQCHFSTALLILWCSFCRTSGPDVQLGYVMVTPMSMSAWEQSSLSWRDRAILVCRGWVPESWKKKSRNPELAEEATALAAKTEGESVVEGVVMRSEVPSYFVPQNTPKQGSWFWIDVPEIAKSCGLPEETVMVQVLDKGSDTEAVELIDSATGGVIGAPMPDAYPVAKRLDEFVQFTVMPRDHLNYAFIWFTLSIATAIMGMRAIRQRALWRMRHGT
ncbi:unnamed protein product [Ostreobium quekettii]|uniref:SURF1-like protein n=1 Tax=Ostreobium quekettii TaxID=121088 RepID=A0A8S1JB19_9CHLO|nr:unnamed protein product [Ostreobium quekettii]